MWCEMDRTDMRFIFGAVSSVVPPPPSDGNEQPTLSVRENLVSLVESGGFKVVDEKEVETPFIYSNAEDAWDAFRSAGLIINIIRKVGEDKIRNAVMPAIEQFEKADGNVMLQNCFRYLVCV
jgi:hypothetical protein